MRLPAAFNRGSDLNREPQPSLDTITGNVATLTTRPPRRRSYAVSGGLLKWRGLGERKKENCSGSKNRTRVARLTGGHANHSAITLCWHRVQTYAISTKPCSFEGGTESHHRIFAAVLTTKPNSPELRRGEPKVLSVHSIRKLNSTPPFSYILPRQRLFRTDNLALMTWGNWRALARVDIRRKYAEKYSVTSK